MYDLIGDIHGHLDPLEALLQKLGYTRQGGFYQHPERQAFFVGDFIDRGPKSKEVVRLARSMVENGAARAVMGNHEWNAIQFHTRGQDGRFLRPREEKNIKQHRATLLSYGCNGLDANKELESDLQWFLTLPMFHEEEGIRVVHATWHSGYIERLKERLPGGIIDEDFLHGASRKGSQEYEISEVLLKGLEVDLPPGVFFHDKDGHARRSARVKWWRSSQTGQLSSQTRPSDEGFANPREVLFVPEGWNHAGLDQEFLAGLLSYPKSHPPVFFGHYWNLPPLKLEASNVCCLDYSVAAGGRLMAYRWNGESTLDEQNMVSVSSVEPA